MSAKRILLVSQEIAPYVPSGDIASLTRNIAQGVHSRVSEVRTFMPKYGTVNERRNQLHEVIRLSGMNIPIDDNDHPLIIKVASLQPSRIQVYFIDNDDYFQKCDDDADAVGTNRTDNDERALFFARGTIETVKKLRWDPAIVHCMGWMTAMAPMYMRHIFNEDPACRDTKIVYSVLPAPLSEAVPQTEVPATDISAVSPVLDSRVFDKLIEDGMAAEYIETFRTGTPDVNTLHLMAIDNADAVVFHTPTPDPVLLEAVTRRGIPYITATPDGSDVQAYKDFYNSLTNENA